MVYQTLNSEQIFMMKTSTLVAFEHSKILKKANHVWTAVLIRKAVVELNSIYNWNA